MDSRIVTAGSTGWSAPDADPRWIEAVEDGKVLYFPRLAFSLSDQERELLRPELLEPGVRNISLNAAGQLKGVAGGRAIENATRTLTARFAAQATALVTALFPKYREQLQPEPTSLRPVQVSDRPQSWRADDRRLHVDSFPSRPNRGRRILRVFSNLNPDGEPRVWRVGEPFADVASRFLPGAAAYSPLRARALRALRVTKSFRTEYDHLMLQLHDRMKSDAQYQARGPQQTVAFPPGSTWVCYSDQTVHAAMSGQHMIEQTFGLPVASQYNQDSSPLAILTRMVGHPLV